MNEYLMKRVEEHNQRLAKLLGVKPVTVQSILKNKQKYQFPCVYILSTPKDEIIYVGKTKTRNLYDRIYQHIYANHKCDLKEMIKFFSLTYQNSKMYKVRFIRIDNNKTRGFFEHFVISVLKPECNKVIR